MVKMLFTIFFLFSVPLLFYCGKKLPIAPLSQQTLSNIANPDSICFERHIDPLIIRYCGQCHVQINSGNASFNGYDNIKSHIDRIIIRTEEGTMPASGPKLTTEQIDTLKAWRSNGEKRCNP